jgi:transposase
MDRTGKPVTIEDLYAIIQAQAATIAALQQEVAELKRQLGFNSQNSGKPPSSDGLKKPPRVQSLRGRSEKPSGGQPGHKGETLRQIENPDIIKKHNAKTCAHCRAKLTAAMVTGVVKRQVFDIPKPRFEVTEHQASIYTCTGCAHLTTAAFPEAVLAAAQYGPRVRAAAVYLSFGQLIPEERVAETMRDLFNVDLCAATVAAIGARKASELMAFSDYIATKVAAASVKHLDETGFRIGGHTQWLHVASTMGLTSYRVSSKRGSLPSCMTGIVIHDHWKPYYTLNGVEHALCNAHHLRELKALIEIEKEPWAKRMYKLLINACQAVQRAIEKNTKAIPISTYQRILRLYDRVVAAGLAFHELQAPLLRKGERGKKPRRTGHNLLLRFLRYKSDVLRFAKDFSVPFTNNQAERDLRMMKVKQKISGCFRTTTGAENFATLRAVISTARKQSWNLLETLVKPTQNLILQLAA